MQKTCIIAFQALDSSVTAHSKEKLATLSHEKSLPWLSTANLQGTVSADQEEKLYT